ncbi:MAG: endonuclease/exonuclease/phosphatase family metal-dependent hydrolase [Bacteroidia bacterium]|jgi:endonuclease/exonuclease/phosphatase family metal-dependent hydrolase
MRSWIIVGLILTSFYGDVSAQSIDETRILTWNVFLRPRHIFWTDNQIERAKLIAEVLAKSDQDVMVLQEAFDKKSVRVMRKTLDSIYPYQILPSKKRSYQLTNGLWLLSKYPIIKRDSIYFCRAGHADKTSDKGAIFARISKNDEVFDVIGTHTQAYNKLTYRNIRLQQYSEMKQKLIDKHELSGVPQYIIGDMNTDKKDTVYYAMMLDSLNAQDGDVTVPKEVKISSSDAQTWGCAYNELIAKKYRGQTQLLDYILVRLNESEAKTLNRALAVYRIEEDGQPINLSDHYGIEVRIEN